MLKGFSLVLLGTMVSSAYASQPLSKEAGWEFTLSLNTGYTQGESQFNTDSDNAITDDLNNSGQSTTSRIVYPLGRIQYTLDSLKTQLFIGNSRDQVAVAQFQYELGMTHQFADSSKLTIAAFPKLALFSDTWADPFLVGSVRQKTDNNVGGGRIALENIMGGPFTLKYAAASSHIDDELSGQSQLTDAVEIASLRRDSLYQRFEVEMMLPMTEGWLLKPNLQYTDRNAEGDANSFGLYKAQLSLLMFQGQHTLVTTVHAGLSQYKADNPIFDDKQDSKQVGIFSVYAYKAPFNWQHWSWNFMAGYQQENSSIQFYDNKAFIMSTGVSFQY